MLGKCIWSIIVQVPVQIIIQTLIVMQIKFKL